LKIITIIGARPQFVKAAALSRVISQHKDMKELIVHTGQHYDKNMSDVFFQEMSIPDPSYHLAIEGRSHGSMTGQMLEKIEKVLQDEKPDAVMVYGDTNSTLAGALAATKLGIKLIHIEAGLRSYNMNMPEEINRILTDRISDILFCPTEFSYNTLRKEGFPYHFNKIFISGDVMHDVALFFETLSDSRVDIKKLIPHDDFVLTTVHRAENTDNAKHLSSIIAALNKINKIKPVVVPMHPRTKKMIGENKISCDFTIIDPVGYLEMIQLIKRSSLVITDSGGLQKEAYFFKKNCVTMRDETEWVELVEAGFNHIAGNTTAGIFKGFETMIHKKNNFAIQLYGDGNASAFIVNKIRELIK
jgi:UDP-GlcNAc3NAcA epimerase